MTQEALAEAARLSVDMVSKIEVGATGARFPVIERLAAALRVDAAELFTTEVPAGAINRGTFADISTRLARLSQSDLVWVSNLIEAALKSKGDATRPVELSPVSFGESGRGKRASKHVSPARPPKAR
jgi:transcriptional regulator with XRE-family HTH domain